MSESRCEDGLSEEEEEGGGSEYPLTVRLPGSVESLFVESVEGLFELREEERPLCIREEEEEDDDDDDEVNEEMNLTVGM